MRKRNRLAPPVAALLLILGCGEAENALSGSVASTHPLRFESVTLRDVAGSYVIAYLRGMETVARLAYVPAQGTAPAPGQTIALSFGNGGNAGLSRATSDRLSFPTPKSGTITFLSELSEGSVVSGRFGVEFTSGQTLQGRFSAALTRAQQ